MDFTEYSTKLHAFTRQAILAVDSGNNIVFKQFSTSSTFDLAVDLHSIILEQSTCVAA